MSANQEAARVLTELANQSTGKSPQALRIRQALLKAARALEQDQDAQEALRAAQSAYRPRRA